MKNILASSDTPLIGQCSEVNYFDDGDYGYVSPNAIVIYNTMGEKREPHFTKTFYK